MSRTKKASLAKRLDYVEAGAAMRLLDYTMSEVVAKSRPLLTNTEMEQILSLWRKAHSAHLLLAEKAHRSQYEKDFSDAEERVALRLIGMLRGLFYLLTWQEPE